MFTITKEKCSGRVIIARNAFLEFFRKFHTPKTLNFAGFHLWIALNLLKYAYSYLYSFFLQYPLSGNLKIYWWESGYQRQVGSKWHHHQFENQVTFHVDLCLHNFLQVGGVSLSVDEKLIKKIYELVGEGVHQVREMVRHLKIFVKNKLFKDSLLPGMSILLFSLN